MSLLVSRKGNDMTKVAGKEHVQHRLYKTVPPLGRPRPPRQPRFEIVRGTYVTYEYDRRIAELRISTSGKQQFIWGDDLHHLKNLLQQEVKPPEGRRRNRRGQFARTDNQIGDPEDGRISFDQWAHAVRTYHSMSQEWRVPEVEQGTCSPAQAAALGLPYRHRITGETIAEWTERTMREERKSSLTLKPDEQVQADQLEQELTHLVRNLPISLTITKRGDTYFWQCLDENGQSEDFLGVVGDGLHTLLGHLMRENQQRREQGKSATPRFGSIVYQTEGYAEYLLTDEKGVRVVICESEGNIKLYRVDWTEPDGYQNNKAIYTLPDAIAAFQEVIGQQQPSRRQETEQLTEEERLALQQLEHEDAKERQRDLPID
jgi:hypothetical protein